MSKEKILTLSPASHFRVPRNFENLSITFGSDSMKASFPVSCKGENKHLEHIQLNLLPVITAFLLQTMMH